MQAEARDSSARGQIGMADREGQLSSLAAVEGRSRQPFGVFRRHDPNSAEVRSQRVLGNWIVGSR